jgi:hypothetical protein
MESIGIKQNQNNNMNNNNNNTQQLDYTYEELQGKVVILSLLEDDGEGGYDENKEFIEVLSKNDYEDLEQTVAEYREQGVLDEYYVVK